MIAQSTVVSKSSIDSVSHETLIQQHGGRLQALVEEMIGGVLQTVQEHRPLHELERETWARLLAMGHEVLALLFALLGPGDVGETVTLGNGATLRRLDLHRRPYQSPFGSFDLERYGYGTREGQALELSAARSLSGKQARHPLQLAQLNLVIPSRDLRFWSS